ncbi:MAG: O-linked N-acetylglucosamine transferase, SPINDLY family protein [Caulobacteraceae bacterium]
MPPHSDMAADLVSGREALLAGDPHAAVEVLGRAVAARPADVEACYWLASALLTARDPEAGAALDRARTLQAVFAVRDLGVDIGRCQADPAYAGEVANQLYGARFAAMSGVIRGLAISGGADDVQSLLSFALALQHQGRIEEACGVFEAAGEAFPSAAVRQFLIYPQVFRDDGDARHAAAARDWARRFAPARPAGPHVNPDRAGRRLRLGFVAPRFAGCQLQQFIAPLLANHDPAAVAVTLYPAEAATEQDWPSWIEVRPTGGLDDAQVAAMIRADGIDVLSDCWGHTAGSRLPVFAHRPAPVQVGWMNFIQSTGLDQMDYVLYADASAIPAGLAEVYTERLWPIGPVFNAFRPSPGRLPPAPSPALQTGVVTFGSFNHPAKLSDPALDAWAAALRGVPAARLLLKYGYFTDPVLQRVTQARFAARGVAPERIVFAGHSTGEAYFQAFREVDLMLDAWPAPGSTTTLDALSNGVPVLVKSTPSAGGLYAGAMLEACGLPELVCETPEAFVDRAVELGSDPLRLDALRARVRPGFDQGPICDEACFTRRVEAAFGEMFDLWRAKAARGAA